MYLVEWPDASLLDKAREAIGNQQFLDACAGCKTIEEMHERLDIPTIGPGVTDDPQAGNKAREQRTFIVAGEPFEVGGPVTYGALYRRLKGLPEPIGPQAGFDDTAWLIEGPLRTSSTKPRLASTPDQTGSRTTQRYASPHLPELVGIVGEMHAFRFLQSKFNIDEHSWVSEFRKKVLPLRTGEVDQTSDSLGYDFRFAYAGKTWCVEVKSTTDHGTSFDLSSGQIATASRIAVRKDERWRILRVRKALSKRPECDWLANPFEPGAGQRLRLRQGSMTVQYTLSKRRSVG